MFYNKLKKAIEEFVVKHKYCPTTVNMSPTYYDNLEKEMVGAQWLFLIKCSKVMGLKIIVDYDIKDFKLE